MAAARGGVGYFFLSAVFGCFGFLGVFAFLSISILLIGADRISPGRPTPSVTPRFNDAITSKEQNGGVGRQK